MSNQNLHIEVQNLLQSGGIKVNTTNLNQAITVTNNKAMYYAEQAKKYKDEAKNMRDLAQYYTEHNSDITQDYVDEVKANLEIEIAAKASASDIPESLSELIDDTSANPIDKADTLTDLTATVAELNFCDGVTSNIQTQLDSKSTYHPPLLSCIWSDHLLEDISWLRADTFSWQSGGVYTSAYNELVSEYNNASSTIETEGSITFKRTPKGYKIASATQETAILNKYNSDGIAWYYILDIANTQFKLPRTKFGFEGLRTNVGNDITESLPNIRGVSSWTNYEDSNIKQNGVFYNASYVGSDILGWASAKTSNAIGFDASRSSSTYQDNAPVQERATQMYLYFYVGEYAQTAIEQTAGLNAELFNGKLDTSTYNANPRTNAVYLKTTYVNGTSGYNIWSNGYCEQWGYFKFSLSPQIITLTKTYQNIDYNICVSFGWNSNYTNDAGSINSNDKTVSSFKVYAQANNTTYAYCYWRAYGYLAEGEY